MIEISAVHCAVLMALCGMQPGLSWLFLFLIMPSPLQRYRITFCLLFFHPLVLWLLWNSPAWNRPTHHYSPAGDVGTRKETVPIEMREESHPPRRSSILLAKLHLLLISTTHDYCSGSSYNHGVCEISSETTEMLGRPRGTSQTWWLLMFISHNSTEEWLDQVTSLIRQWTQFSWLVAQQAQGIQEKRHPRGPGFVQDHMLHRKICGKGHGLGQALYGKPEVSFMRIQEVICFKHQPELRIHFLVPSKRLI